MAETLTESFCERCGTRYEFHAPTRLNPLRKTRGFIGGLRNYLTSQDALSDAMGDAMRTEEDGLSSAQLEAFHESFNFCIDCRQYTCVNCWNDAPGRCRSCAPIPGTDDLAERLAAPAMAAPLIAEEQPALTNDEIQRRLGRGSWPTSDLPTDAEIGSNADPAEAWLAAQEFPAELTPVPAEIEPEPVAADLEREREPVMAEIEFEPEPAVSTAEFEQEPMVAEFEQEPMVAEFEQEPELMRPPLRVVAWDDDNQYQLVEPEPLVALETGAGEAEPEPEPLVAEAEFEPIAAEIEPIAAEAEPEAMVAEIEFEPIAAEVEPQPEPIAAEVEPEPMVAENEFEPIAAEVEPEPEPIAAEVEPERHTERPTTPRIAPISETILAFPTRSAPDVPGATDDRAAAVADSPEVAARRAQLDLLGLGDPGQGPVTPEAWQALPYRSRGAGVTQSEMARQAALRGSFWEASAREVAGAPGRLGVQSCGRCGLSLSANARFCRRCGTRQAQSA